MGLMSASRLLIVIYLRVSTEEQARKGYSLPEQREACRQKALQIAADHQKAVGMDVAPQIMEFVDDFGGDIAERPVLEELREFVRTRHPAWVVCMDPDRFSRSLKLQLIVADDIEAQTARLAFVQQDYNPDDLMSKAFFQFRGLMSELDKAKILERTTRGKRGKIKAGKRPNGATPYGYIHHKESDQLRIYEPEAQWVRSAFHWVAYENMGVYLVTRRLNGLGVPTKRHAAKWNRSVVRDLLRNTTYYGKMRCNRKDFSGLGSIRRLPPEKRKPLSAHLRPEAEWITVPVPPLISRELFDLAQANLQPTTKRGGRRDTGLLSMLLRCGECGGRMSYARHSGGHHYLRCQRRYAYHGDYRPGSPRCTNPHQRSAPVEAFVWTKLVAWLTEPSLLRQYLDEQRHSLGPRELVTRLEAEKQAIAERLAAEHKVQAAVIRRQALGQVAEEAADRMLQESNKCITQLRTEVDLLEQRLGPLRAQLDHAEEIHCRLTAAADQVAAEAQVTREQLSALEPNQRRKLVMMVVQQVTVMRDATATITLREA
jgi:site-specific DNA recombinase